MILKIFKYHLKFLYKEFFYILKICFTEKKLFSTILYISFKFLIDSGIKNLINKRKYINEKQNYGKLKKEKLKYTNDWFSHNITTWVSIFKKKNIENQKLNILEIGSYEGLSAVFFLNFFKNSNLTCIETFKGSDEHSDINFETVKENFKSNVELYKNRITLFEGTSDFFFKNKINVNKKDMYDIIYIDGSHHHDDVLNDAFNSFELLNNNGMIIFDDFLKKYYKNINQDPIKAILNFINKNKHCIDIVNVNYQIVIKKNN